jgi:hypothetical protein
MARPRSSRSIALGTALLAVVLLVLLLAAVSAGARAEKVGISARVSGAVDNGAVSMKASCNASCASVRAVGTITGKSVGKVALGAAFKHVQDGRATLALRIPASARRKINAALDRGERVMASLRVTGLNAAGRPLVTASGSVQLGP